MFQIDFPFPEDQFFKILTSLFTLTAPPAIYLTLAGPSIVRSTPPRGLPPTVIGIQALRANMAKLTDASVSIENWYIVILLYCYIPIGYIG
jgi:hypothetical protein